MLQTKQSVDLRIRLTEDHLESRKSIARLRAGLAAVPVALDLAAAHIDYAIRGIENPNREDAFADSPAHFLVSLIRDRWIASSSADTSSGAAIWLSLSRAALTSSLRFNFRYVSPRLYSALASAGFNSTAFN
jgi:hypothetical protein